MCKHDLLTPDVILGLETRVFQAVELSLGEYVNVRYDYWVTIVDIIRKYLFTPDAPVTKYRNQFYIIIQDVFYTAFEIGLAESGGQVPAQGDNLVFINARAVAERGFVETLFVQLRELKAEAKKTGDSSVLHGEAERRADGYCRTLDAIYSEGKIRGAEDMVLTFGGIDGKESCATCTKLKGYSAPASWWVSHGLIPGRPGNNNYDCGGYKCQHVLFDKFNNVYVL